jgi:hypothetical protein
MSLLDLAVADNQSILLNDGEAATLIPPTGTTTYACHVLYMQTGVSQDAEGFAVVGDKSVVSISLAELVAAGLTDTEALKVGIWKITVKSRTLELDKPMLDRSLGIVTSILRRTV